MKVRSLSLLISLQIMLPVVALASGQAALGYRSLDVIKVDGLNFKDLNRDGQLNPYEDWRLSPEVRAKDLVNRMTLHEKAGVMMHGSAPAPNSNIGVGSEYDIPAAKKMIADEKVNSFITRLDNKPSQLAEQNNLLQAIAEATRLGIPATISIDPRSSFEYSFEPTSSPSGFSQWPETLGIAAINNEDLTRRYADIIRQEYRAIGVTQALSPQADLATEPRWSRATGTFGEDPERVKKMVRGYITGMQNGKQGLNNQSVSAVVKHWVGYGAAELGYDSHSAYGKNALFTGGDLAVHIYPFAGAFDAKVAGVMPTYSILKGATYEGKSIEQVGAGFNTFLLQDILRGKYQFDGVIVSDWLITDDCVGVCLTGYPPGEQPDVGGMSWGVEHLSKPDRFVKAVNAGIDQFGGVTDSSLLVLAVQQGKLSEARLNESVRRILQQKFELGLFEDPYVIPAEADKILGRADWQVEADRAQRDSLVLLENRGNLLPLKSGTKVFLYGINPNAARNAGFTVVDSADKAEVAVIRAHAPYEQPHKNFFFGARYHEGSLEFKADDPILQQILAASAKVPTIVTVYLDRPAVLTPIKDKASVLIGNFGVSDAVLFSALSSQQPFIGKLPFELPSSMNAVLKQHSDRPADSLEPLYPLGFGL